MKRIGILLLAVFFCFVSTAWPQAFEHGKPQIIVIDAPGAGTASGQGTSANVVNPAGVVTGWYLDPNNTYYSFLRTPHGKIITFSPPGAGTGTYQGSGGWGINPAGVITGDYVDVSCLEHGFIREPDGEFISFEAPGAGTIPSVPCTPNGVQGTIPANINPAGEIAGITLDTNNVYHVFLRSPRGKFIIVDAPGAGIGPFQGTWISFEAGLAAQGSIAGWYIDGTYTYHAYVRTPDGNIATFDGPGVAVQFTLASGVNSQGAAVGTYLDAANLYHGFLRTKEGKITTIDVPFAGTGAYQGTQPEANNDEGVVTGNYIDANGANHGYVLSPDGGITSFDAPGAGLGSGQGTIPYYISPEGAITGVFIDANGVSHGFLRLADREWDR